MKKKDTSEIKASGNPLVQTITGPLEKAIFAARWLLAPFYIGLVLTLLLLLMKFLQQFTGFMSSFMDSGMQEVELEVLALLDLALLGNLILIVVFAGYENFVSKIESAENSIDRPEWMGKVDFSGLKLKLIGSLVAISVIELLKDFMEADQHVNDGLRWRIAIHLVFVFSGLLFAIMDAIAARTDNIVEARQK